MIVVPDNISIKNITSLYAEIASEMKARDDVLLDFARVRRLDLAVVQLIIAAGRSARERGKTLRLRSVSDHIRWQMEMCGVKT